MHRLNKICILLDNVLSYIVLYCFTEFTGSKHLRYRTLLVLEQGKDQPVIVTCITLILLNSYFRKLCCACKGAYCFIMYCLILYYIVLHCLTDFTGAKHLRYWTLLVLEQDKHQEVIVTCITLVLLNSLFYYSSKLSFSTNCLQGHLLLNALFGWLLHIVS